MSLNKEISKVLQSMSEEDRKTLGENAREKVLAKYTWSKHVERIMEHFKSL